MPDFSTALKDAAKGALCSYLDGFAAFLRLPWLPFTSGLVPLLAAESLRSTIARNLCNKEVPPLPIPYSGGQCDTLYTVTVTATGTEIPATAGKAQTATGSNTWRGPITSVRLYNPHPVTGAPGFHILGRSSNPSPTWNGFFPVLFFSDSIFESVSIDSISVVRVDGLVDDCGNPLPDTKPYNKDDYSYDIDITYTNNDGVDITVPVGVAVGLAYLDADLNLTVPINFTFSPNFNFDPTFKFDIPVNFNFNTNDFDFGIPTPTGDPPITLPPPPDFDFDFDFDIGPTPAPPPDVPPDPPDDPEPPLSPVIRGVVVTTTSVESGANVSTIGQDLNPDVYVPDLGLVSFQILTRGGVAAWTEDIRVKNKRTFITCPWPGGAIDVKGTPRPGVSMSLSKVYGKPDPNV